MVKILYMFLDGIVMVYLLNGKLKSNIKKIKKIKTEVPITEFRKECREFAEKWIEVHKTQFKRLGVVGDWENYYATMSFEAEAQIVRELGKFLKEGSLYRGFKPGFGQL